MQFTNIFDLISSVTSPPMVTKPVKSILISWAEISNDMLNMSDKLSFEKLYKYDFPLDKQIANDFLKNFQNDSHDGKFIINSQSYLNHYSSIMLYYKDIKFGFPFQCRQWPKSNILNRILQRIIKSFKGNKKRIDISGFLIIWESERNKEIISLNANDILILRSLTNKNTLYNLEEKNSKMFINSNLISKKTGISKSNTKNRINRMWMKGVLSTFYITNPTNLNFKTITRNEEMDKDFENFLLIKVPFNDLQFFVYQIPNNYNNIRYNSILKNLETGYSLANLKPNGRIISKLYRELYEKPIAVENTSQIIDIQHKTLEINEKDINILKHFTPAIYNLEQKSNQLESIFKLSTSRIDHYINKFLKNQFIYQFTRILFVGYPINVALYLQAKPEEINFVKSYLRQFFRYYIYSNEKELFAFLRMTKIDFKILNMTIFDHKSNFENVEINMWDTIINTGIQIKKSIDWRNLDFEIDPFFGIKWKYPNNSF